MLMNKTIPLLFCLTTFIFTACDRPCKEAPATCETKPPTAQEVFAQIPGTEWKLDHWTGADGTTRDPGPITLAVSDNNRLSGNAGVNRYMGPLQFNTDGTPDFATGFATTMMAGIPEAAERETNYLTELRQITAARLEDGRLILTGQDPLRMEFAPQSAPEADKE